MLRLLPVFWFGRANGLSSTFTAAHLRPASRTLNLSCRQLLLGPAPLGPPNPHRHTIASCPHNTQPQRPTNQLLGRRLTRERKLPPLQARASEALRNDGAGRHRPPTHLPAQRTEQPARASCLSAMRRGEGGVCVLCSTALVRGGRKCGKLWGELWEPTLRQLTRFGENVGVLCCSNCCGQYVPQFWIPGASLSLQNYTHTHTHQPLSVSGATMHYAVLCAHTHYTSRCFRS